MAVAGLHNVSVLESSFHRESQSPVSRQWGNHDRPSTGASSIMQMWRELEGEHVVSHPQVRLEERQRQQRCDGSNSDFASTCLSEGQGIDNGDSLEDDTEVENECGTWSQGQMGLQNENEDSNSSSSEQSTDFGEVERERVRQIFQEWMNSGVRGHTPNISHMNNCSRAQWLGENERERVRIVREWVKMTSQQIGTCGDHREEQAAEIGSQIELVRDGLVVNHCEIGARRAIRRLCGRQALLDLLMKAERERKRELQGLLEHRPVSDFAHRNRIQSLLRGRFLQNGRLIQDERPTSVAASELGLLRQRHTVSGLREGFLSRLDNFVCGPVSCAQSDASSNDDNGQRNEQSQANNELLLDEICDQSEPTNGETEINGFHIDDFEGILSGDVNQQESTVQVEGTQEQVLDNEEREQQRSLMVEAIGTRDNEWSQETLGMEGSEQSHLLKAHEVFHEHYEASSEGAHGISGHANSLQGNTVEDTSAQVEESELQQLASVEFNEWIDSNVEQQQSLIVESFGTRDNEWSQETLGMEGSEQSHLLEVFHAHYEASSEESDAHGISGQTDSLEGNTVEAFNWQDTSAHVEEWQESVTENEESDLQQSSSVEFNEWIDVNGEGIDGNWQELTANQWYQETSGNDGGDHSLQESHEEWHENGLQESMDNWPDGPSGQEAAPVGRIDAFYFPDNDNVYSMELRELLSRRRVSHLLRSGFRESLDQLIQSYVERQGHASVDWELDGTSSSPAYIEQNQEQQNGDQNAGQSDAVERTPLVLSSPPVTPSQPLWDQELHDANWLPHNIHQRLGTEWEIINDLRIDMARLQQRMNNMQRMLEACMDMQLELQRSVRQEVSAALNWSAGSRDACEDSLPNESKWDHVRKGICCICCDCNIDSLLYRCGHMCTCLKCADKLVQGIGKCPMCWAPVVEVIRAYSIQ